MWTSLCRYLPEPQADCLRRVPLSLRETAQEVRLRGGQPLLLTTANGAVPLAATVSQAAVRECFWRCCGHAVHTHQAELAQGFVTTPEGFRVGVAGTAVIKDGVVTSCRDITAVCIRLPRMISGCAAPLFPFVSGGGLHGLLLCGAPSSGKTTLLRDLAATLSVTHAISVVDERGELAVDGACDGCDVLRGYPKGEGVLQAVRTLSPDAVVVDELGLPAEWEAVVRSCYCGVAVFASAHIASVGEARARPALMTALRHGAFAYAAFLPPRRRSQDETVIVKARDLVEDTGNIAGRVCLRGVGVQNGSGAAR